MTVSIPKMVAIIMMMKIGNPPMFETNNSKSFRQFGLYSNGVKSSLQVYGHKGFFHEYSV